MLCRDYGDERIVAMALEDVGECLAQLGEVEAAREAFSETLELLRAHGTDLEIGKVLVSSGYLDLARGDYERAIAGLEEGVERMRRTSRTSEVAYALVNLGSAHLAFGELTAAEAELLESCSLYRSAMDPVGYAYAVEALGVLKERRGAHEDAVQLLGAADRIFRENGAAVQSFELAIHDSTVQALRAALGETVFADAWSRGAELTDDDIAAVVERMPPVVTRPGGAGG